MTTTKSALVTGITGQDGSYLAELLLSKGYDVYGLVRRKSTPDYPNIQHIADRLTLIDGDLTDHASLVRALQISKPHEVYNLAAQSFVQTSFVQPATTCEINSMGVLRLLEAIRQVAPTARFYQAGTSEMFGNAPAPQSEKTAFEPRSPYGVSKVFAHYMTRNYREAYGLHASNGVLFNHESSRRGEEFVTRKICKHVAQFAAHGDNAPKLRLGNLDAKRDWGHARDFVNAMWLIQQQETPGDWVIATGETHSVREFLDTAFAYVGIHDWTRHVVLDEAFVRPAEVNLLLGDPRKARRDLRWEPMYSFKQLVHDMMNHELAAINRATPTAAYADAARSLIMREGDAPGGARA